MAQLSIAKLQKVLEQQTGFGRESGLISVLLNSCCSPLFSVMMNPRQYDTEQ